MRFIKNTGAWRSFLLSCSYAGFVPGLKFKVGQSFSTITGKLLRDESVSGSPWMVLTNFQKTRPYEETDLIRHILLQERERSLNRAIYHEHMGVTSYTGRLCETINGQCHFRFHSIFILNRISYVNHSV